MFRFSEISMLSIVFCSYLFSRLHISLLSVHCFFFFSLETCLFWNPSYLPFWITRLSLKFSIPGLDSNQDYVANSHLGLTRVTKHVAEFFVLAKPISLFYLNVLNNNSGLKKSTTCAVSQSVSQSISQLVQSPIFLRLVFLYKTVGVMIPSNKVWWPSSDRKEKK